MTNSSSGNQPEKIIPGIVAGCLLALIVWIVALIALSYLWD